MMRRVPINRVGTVPPDGFNSSHRISTAGTESEWLDWSRNRISRVDEIVRDQTRRHPLPMLGGALILGVALGWLIKKR